MDLKKTITSYFNKEAFAIQDCGAKNNSDWDSVDERLRGLLQKLNQNKNIVTYYSCEGHVEGDTGYIFFNVNEEGWDIFWQQVIPELSFRTHLCSEFGTYTLPWTVETAYKEGDPLVTVGIIVRLYLTPIQYHSWDQTKEMLWTIVEETFLKYYNE